MPAPEYHRAYRRGIVLGLSLAELFILLVFLLLLALIGYSIWQEEIFNKQQKIMDEQQDKLDRLTPILDHDPNDLLSAIERVKEQEQIIDELEKTIIEQKEASEQFRDKLTLDERYERQEKTIAEQKKIIDEQENTITEQNKIIEQTRRKEKKDGDGEVLGQESPCWYTVVQGQDEEREKVLFIFDVRIKDATILVQKHHIPPPPGAYTPEVKYDPSMLGNELPYVEFMHEFESLKIAGRNKHIRDRRCYFHVMLWDETTNKTAYKRAFNDFVNQVFVPTLVAHNPWPK